MTEEMTVPGEAVIPLPRQDHDKEAAIRAATYYDRVETERTEQRRLMEQAKIALEVQLHRNADLQKQLDDERRMRASDQQFISALTQDKADLEATLAVEQDHHEDRAARLSRFEFSRLKRRNGKHPKRNGDSVPVDTGSEVEVAIDPSVLASGS
jgi:septal ring factor EnvC (AmiA/AmiB activator)